MKRKELIERHVNPSVSSGETADELKYTDMNTVQEFPGHVKEIPVRGVRKIIAEKMRGSLRDSAQLTLNASADASVLLSYRKLLKKGIEKSKFLTIGINDMILFAVTKTLCSQKDLNAHFLGDKIVQFEHVHLGFAVDTPRGLMVPVIRYAESLSLSEISNEAKRLGKACIDRTIAPDELSGGSFTVTNLGPLGIESFTPVLNTPQVGILGVCTIQLKPVMNGENVEFIPHIGLSLTFDHQAVDGAPAARFLQELSGLLAGFNQIEAGLNLSLPDNYY